MSACERIEELISLSVSGELTPAEAEELRAHLAGCAHCRRTLERERRLWRLIQRSRAEAAEAEKSGDAAAAVERLAAKVRGGSRPATTLFRRWWFLTATGAAAAVVFLAAWWSVFGRRARTRTRPLPVPVAEVVRGELLVADGEGWRKTRRVLSGRFFRVPGEPGAYARLKLCDGSRLDLERGAFGRLGRGFAEGAAGDRVVELPVGALTARVAKAGNKFVVGAPGGRVEAVGTRFWVRSGPPNGEEKIVGKKSIVAGTMAAALAVAVFEGSVLVRKAGAAEAVTVEAGKQAVVDRTTRKTPRVSVRTVAGAVPADAWFFAAAAGRARWRRAVDNSALGATWREREVKTFLRPVAEKLKRLLRNGKQKLEAGTKGIVNLDELERALIGEVGVALLNLKPKTGGRPGEDPVLLFVAEVGENAEAFEIGMNNFLGRLAQMGLDVDAALRVETYRGADLHILKVDDKGGVIVYTTTRGYFLFGMDTAAVKKSVDCLEGARLSVSRVAKITKSPDSLLNVSVNLAALLKHERAKGTGLQDWKNLDALGFTAAQRLEYRLRFKQPAFRESLSVSLSKARGLLELLAHARPANLEKAAAGAPAEALAFFAAALPADKFIPLLLRTMDNVAPRKAAQMRTEIEAFKRKTGIDWRKMLGESLTGEVSVYAARPAGGGLLPEVVAVAWVKENRAVGGLLQFLAANVTPVEYGGGKLYVIPLKKNNPVVPSVLVLADRLIFGSSPTAVKRAAGLINAAPEKTLAGNAAFRKQLRALPSGAVAVQYLDLPRAFNLVYGTALPFLSSGPWLKQKLGLDPVLLPQPETVSKHLAPEITGCYADAKGVKLVVVGNFPRATVFGLAAAAAAGKGRKRHSLKNKDETGAPPPDDAPLF